MNRLSIGKKIGLGFGLALALLLLIDFVSYRNIRMLVRTMEHVVHTHRVQDQLDALLLELNHAETGQRGYLLTGEERYLQPYRRASQRIDQELDLLQRLTRDNPSQQQRLARLRILVEEKRDELRRTVDLRQREGYEAAVQVVLTDEGQRIMDRLRALIDEMHEEEESLLWKRDRAAQTRTAASLTIIIVGSVLGFSLLGLAMYLILTDVAERRRAEAALRKAHGELEVRVRDRTSDLRHTNRVLQGEVAKRERAQSELAETFLQIEKSRDDMRSILNRLQTGTVMVDDNQRVVFLSDTARHLLGVGMDEVRGSSWIDVFPLDGPDTEQLIAACEARPETRKRIPVHLRCPSGAQYWAEVDVQDDPRREGGKIFFFYDLTEVYVLRRRLDERVRFQDLVGKSPPMQQVYQRIREISAVDSTVLIEGETGTGKELVARAIHSNSHRAAGPFVVVNAAGLTESLLGSQLFGHKRGAFTGAIGEHRGLFEAAEKGTICLDEIGDIPASVQTNLLRVLQEKEITRLGETKPRRINVRILAATHHDLSAEVEAGNFRSDLLFRIRVARITLPPLRERREDIPLLVHSFLGEFRTDDGRVLDTSAEVMGMLLDYPWPGNVRELKSAIEFAVIRAKGPVLQVDDLPPEIGEPAYSANGRSEPGDPGDERQRILDALEAVRGNRTAAAKFLGISRSTLYRRLISLDIHRP